MASELTVKSANSIALNGPDAADAARILGQIESRTRWLVIVAAGVSAAATTCGVTGHSNIAIGIAMFGSALAIALGLALVRDCRDLRAVADGQMQAEARAATQASALADPTTYNQQLFMLSPVGLASRELDARRLLDANPAYLELIGYSLDEARQTRAGGTGGRSGSAYGE